MLSLARNCATKLLNVQVKTFLNENVLKTIQKTSVKRSIFGQNSSNTQYFTKNSKINSIRQSGTISVQLSSEATIKGKKAVGYWLLTCSGMVFGAVVLGGITRLTESGLSMVTWKLLGEKMPVTHDEWVVEFKKYQQYPEFQIKNKMTLSEFKRIWYMEYAHRMWGRAIGAVFLLPAVVFWSRGMFTKALKIRVVVFGALIAAQGLMGWYMVKSGLEDRFHGESDIPRVSQYRLATHLGLAFVLYTLFLWSAFDSLLPAATIHATSREVIKSARQFRWFAHSCKGMVFLTAISGAFVAGLDAGLVYNSFPKMADKWIPDDILALEPKAANITENPTTVQFNHRILGTTSLALVSGLWLISRKRILPKRAYTAATAFGIMAWIQVILGLSTLLTYVPTSLAASHQAGSLLTISTALWLTHELKRLPK